jgi:hypothetical protein
VRLTEAELKEVLRSQTARRVRGDEACLSEEALRRAASKDLNRAEREHVAQHLTRCSDCAREYGIAHTVRAWAGQAANSALQAPLRNQPQQAHSFSQAGHTGRFASRPYRRFLSYALAASVLALIALSLGIVLIHRADTRYVTQLNGQLAERDRTIVDLQQSIAEAPKSSTPAGDTQPGPVNAGGEKEKTAPKEDAGTDLSSPLLNVPIIDLDSGQARGVADGSITRINVPRSANLFALILHISSQQPEPSYVMEISSVAGKVIWRGRGLKNTPENGLTLALSRHLMPAGKYRIQLYGPDRRPNDPVEKYVVEVHYR